jgi:diguanylate cyclase (GGDEF)-like protein
MHPAHDDHAAPLGEHIDGRNSLRLVKLRLALTLAAVAIFPMAAVAPVIRIIADDPRAAQEARLAAQAEHAAAEIERELGTIRQALTTFATGDAAAAALGAKPSKDGLGTAAAALTTVVGSSSQVVNAAALFDAKGAIRVEAGAAGAFLTEKVQPPPASPVIRLAPGSTPESTRLEVAVAVPGPADAAPRGTIVASIPVAGLLAWATADLPSAGRWLSLADGQGGSFGTVEVVTKPSDGGPILPDPAASTSRGMAPFSIQGFDGWSVVASAPALAVSLPLPALIALVLLLLVLAGGTWFMGRQIVAPAAELEEQRAHFEELYQRAREASLLDNLTGLGNHRAFQEALARMVEGSHRYGRPFGLIMFDIDEFKRVNDTRGHAVGDELLAEVGEIIRASTRGVDTGYRIGGDEFAIILPETESAGTEVTARRILRRGLEERASGRYREPISFSAGVTACPEFGVSRLELTAQADAALYRGKRAGRTCVTIFNAELDKGHVDEGMRSELSAAISAVIESGSLGAVYQPIVHLPTGRILGYEGLVRVGGGSGFPHVGALFDAAEIAGRILDLDRAALEVVLRGASGLPPETLLSVNVSPRSFEAPEFNPTVFLAILRRHGIPPERVLLELTERDAIREPDRLRVTIQSLQAAGVRIAADDVGAGNAGLRLLSQFRFDVVKIDLSLVQGGASLDQTLTVLTSLIELARRSGSLTIAEGVETAAQLRMIRELGVDAGQGYFLGRPGAILGAAGIDLDALAGPVEPGATSTAGLPSTGTPFALPARPADIAGRRPVPAGSAGPGVPAAPVTVTAWARLPGTVETGHPVITAPLARG